MQVSSPFYRWEHREGKQLVHSHPANEKLNLGSSSFWYVLLVTELKPDERVLYVTGWLGQEKKIKTGNDSWGELAQNSEIPSTSEAHVLELTLVGKHNCYPWNHSRMFQSRLQSNATFGGPDCVWGQSGTRRDAWWGGRTSAMLVRAWGLGTKWAYLHVLQRLETIVINFSWSYWAPTVFQTWC